MTLSLTVNETLKWLSSLPILMQECLVTLSLTINETLKWLSSLPISMQESHSGGGSVAIGI